jgi:hypothetical protein
MPRWSFIGEIDESNTSRTHLFDGFRIINKSYRKEGHYD